MGVALSTIPLTAVAIPYSQVPNLRQLNPRRNNDMTHIFSPQTEVQLDQRVTNLPLAVASPSPNRQSSSKEDPFLWLWFLGFSGFGLFILWQFVTNMTKGSGGQTRGNSSDDYFHHFDSDSGGSEAESSSDGGDFGGGSSGGGGDGGDW